MWGFVREVRPLVGLNPVRWLPSHRVHVVLCCSSFLVLGVAFLSLVGVGLLGFLGVCFVFGVLVHEGFTA